MVLLVAVLVVCIAILAAVLGFLVWQYSTSTDVTKASGKKKKKSDSHVDDSYDDDDDDDICGTSINTPTRGNPEDYKYIGNLSFHGEGEAAQGFVIVKLFGRRNYAGSHRFNYYAEGSDKIKIHLSFEGRKCSEGCEELSDGDILVIEQLNDAQYKLHKNPSEADTYIPV